MIEEIKRLKVEAEDALKKVGDLEALESFRLEYLIKKGKLQTLFAKMKDVPKEEKPAVGKELNIMKKAVEGAFGELRDKLEKQAKSAPDIDLSLPGRRGFRASYHPIPRGVEEMVEVFVKLGFDVADGPEIEDEYHNFDALNFPPEHPARDLQDTFFMKTDEKLVLRTHTSPVQIRVMKAQKPPIRCVMPGRVYRNEAINARSLAEFHQIEGLYIDKGVTFAELKSTLMTFAAEMYGRDAKFRFRPHFFPFTEPSAELDIDCFLCGGKGCRVCKYTGWLEVLGCGMVHPNVLKAGGIDPEIYSGYAFGLGIERVMMLRTGIKDIRTFYDNDLRALRQF